MAKKDTKVDLEHLSANSQAQAHADKASAQDAERVADAEETAVEYIDYEAALKNYEDRSDVEPLAQRRAREAGSKFEDARFRRTGEGSGAVVTSPKDKNVEGAGEGTK